MGGGVSTESAGRYDTSNCSSLITDDLREGFNILSQLPSSRHAFVKFVRSGAWSNEMSLEKVLAENSQKAGEVADLLTQKVDSYVLPDETYESQSSNWMAFEMFNREEKMYMKKRDDKASTASCYSEEEATTNLTTKPTFDHELQFTNIALEQSPESSLFSDAQMKLIIFAYLFPLFLKSTEFSDWMTNKEPMITPAHSFSDKKVLPVSVDTPSQRVKAAVLKTAISMAENEMEDVLAQGNWMSGFSASVENLPLCVTVASARAEKSGFPLIYVNSAFEKMTGYSREEILGQNCRFLQCEKTEPEQIEKLREALRDRKPTKVALTNRRKDGTQFFNLLAMKPVMDAQGEYAYVVAVQYDIDSPTASRADLKRIDDLLFLLPTILQ
jgi:PAS domain S-box-containing protein